MATIKSYTDLEQSKKLAEILPFESADMHYFIVDSLEKQEINYAVRCGTPIVKTDIPGWSLAALLSILPNNEHITTSVSRGSWQLETITYLPNTWWCEYEDSDNLTEFNTSTDNPVDACVEMIIRLNELNLL